MQSLISFLSNPTQRRQNPRIAAFLDFPAYARSRVERYDTGHSFRTLSWALLGVWAIWGVGRQFSPCSIEKLSQRFVGIHPGRFGLILENVTDGGVRNLAPTGEFLKATGPGFDAAPQGG